MEQLLTVEFWKQEMRQFSYERVIDFRIPVGRELGGTVYLIARDVNDRKSFYQIHNADSFDIRVTPTSLPEPRPVPPTAKEFLVKTRFVAAAGNVNERTFLMKADSPADVEGRCKEDSILKHEVVVYCQEIKWDTVHPDWAMCAFKNVLPSVNERF